MKQTDWKDSTKAIMEAYGDSPKDFPYQETKQETLEEVWEQTMHLRFFLKRKNGCKSENVLQQLFISNLGNKEWTDVPSLKY